MSVLSFYWILLPHKLIEWRIGDICETYLIFSFASLSFNLENLLLMWMDDLWLEILGLVENLMCKNCENGLFEMLLSSVFSLQKCIEFRRRWSLLTNCTWYNGQIGPEWNGTFQEQNTRIYWRTVFNFASIIEAVKIVRLLFKIDSTFSSPKFYWSFREATCRNIVQ